MNLAEKTRKLRLRSAAAFFCRFVVKSRLMNIYITRHGQTDWNLAKKLQGRSDIPLNGNGILQATQTFLGLKKNGITFDRVYSSPLLRAEKTAEIISGFSGDKIIKDKRIIEFSFGDAEGRTLGEIESLPELEWIKNFFGNPEKYKPKGSAETFDSVLSRTQDFWESEIRNLPLRNPECENVLVVTHGGTLQSLLLHVDGRKLSEYWDVKFPNCSMNLVKLNSPKLDSEKLDFLNTNPEKSDSERESLNFGKLNPEKSNLENNLQKSRKTNSEFLSRGVFSLEWTGRVFY